MQTEIDNIVVRNQQATLPPGWRWVRLSEVCISNENRDPRDTPDISFRYVDISSVDNHSKRIIDARKILGKDAPHRARQVIKANDVLVATTRPNLNAVALVPEELDNEICSTGFCVLRPTEFIEPLFLFTFVQTQYFIETISDQVRGMLYPAVTDNQVRNVYLPLPPLPEQRRIATKLQELMQEVERVRIAVEKQSEAANSLPSAYLREVFESEDVKKWEKKKLGDTCDFLDHKRIPVNDEERQRRIRGKPQSELYPYYGANGQIGWIDSYIFDEELVLLAEDGGFFGSCEKPIAYRVSGRCWVNNHAHVLKPKNDVDVGWLHLSLMIRPDVGDMITGSTRPKLNQEIAAQIPISLPPLSEQNRIVSDLKEKMTQVEKLRTSIEKQLETINALPQVILRKAFRGE